jgi:hypothetical protein
MKITQIGFILISLFLSSAQAVTERKLNPEQPQPQVEYFPESTWGQSPVVVTKELVCLQHSDLCPEKKADGYEQSDFNEDQDD